MMLLFNGAYTAGRFSKPKKHQMTLVKRDPGHSDLVIGQWCDTAQSIDEAVAAAKHAFELWSLAKPDSRHAYLRKLQQIFKERRQELATRISSEMGKILPESLAEVDATIKKFDVTIKEALQLVATKQMNGGYYSYRPQGVLVILGPFNFPLHLPNGNWVAALATGNTIVYKPSELTPFTGQLIAECFHEAGFPKGVFNLIQGGRRVGDQLVRHPDINGIIFVGSDTTGRAIQRAVSDEPQKICVLEMGGKNASVILKDAPLEQAIQDCATSAMTTTGQRCNALSRVIIHEDLLTHFTSELAKLLLSWTPGHFTNPDARMGPLVSDRALKNYLRYQQLASQEGASLILAGRAIESKNVGHYVSPGMHRVDWKGPDAQQTGYCYDEIFGPDIAIYTFKQLAQAIEIHNDCRYGLVASVYTKDQTQFETLLQKLEVGNLNWNRPTIGSSPHLPFGGIKASGNHFPAGLLSPLFCTYPISVQK